VGVQVAECFYGMALDYLAPFELGLSDHGTGIAMTKPTAVFRFDGSSVIGAGHAMRSGALADALTEKGWRTVCATRMETIEMLPGVLDQFDDVIRLEVCEAAEIDTIAVSIRGRCDAMVVDHYGRDQAFRRACRRLTSCLTVIEDRPDVVQDGEILVEPSAGVNVAGSTIGNLLAGPRYALLRTAFCEARTRSVRRRDHGSVLLLCGYADERNVTERLLESLDGTPGVRSIHVVIGAANAHRVRVQRRLNRAALPAHLHIDPSPMVGLMSRAAIAVTAAGSTCWELACLGVPMVTVVTAANQCAVDRTLREAGASASTGALDDAHGTRLRETVAALLADDGWCRRMTSCGRTLVDGRGAMRVARAIHTRALPLGRGVA